MILPLACYNMVITAAKHERIEEPCTPVYDDEIEFSRPTIPTPRRVSPKKAWKRRGKRGRK